MNTLIEKLEELSAEFLSSDNEILKLAEESDNKDVLLYVAKELVEIANRLDACSKTVATLKKSAGLSIRDINEMAALAESFDRSNDEFLKRQASVLDQILINFAQTAPKTVAGEDKIEELRSKLRAETTYDKYHSAGIEHAKDMKSKEAIKAINDRFKTYRTMEMPLKTRHCLDHPGAMLMRISDDVYQCGLDNKTYDYRSGFTLLNGNKVPGGAVQEQTKALGDRILEKPYFSTRESKTKNF